MDLGQLVSISKTITFTKPLYKLKLECSIQSINTNYNGQSKRCHPMRELLTYNISEIYKIKIQNYNDQSTRGPPMTELLNNSKYFTSGYKSRQF